MIDQADLFFWLVARAAGIAAFVTVTIATLSGIAVRSSVLRGVASERAWRDLHTTTELLWIPLGGIHLLTLLVDRTARIALADLVVPFNVAYGRAAIGLGTVALDLFVLVAVTGWLRRSMSPRLWLRVHQLSYVAFAATFAHAVLAGTDFSAPAVSAAAWSIAFAVGVLAIARLLWGRLPA